MPLSPTLTVIYGGNGRGKTSFCEGWHWLFSGELLESLDPQSELSSAEENIHTEKDPYVKVLGEKGEVLAERSNEDFSNPGGLPTNASPVLLQYRLQQILYTSQANRREFFEEVMGLQLESNFAKKLRRACQNIDPQAHKSWEAWERAIEAIKQENYSPPYSPPETSEEQKENEKSLVEELSDYFGCKATLDEIEHSMGDASHQDQLPLNEISPPVQESTISEIKAALETIDDLDNEAEQAFNRAQWREKGLNFLEPPECPFCMEDTIDEAKCETIKDDIEETKAKYDQHKRAKDNLNDAIGSITPLANLNVENTRKHLKTLQKRIEEIEIEKPDGTDSSIEGLENSLEELSVALSEKPKEIEGELKEPQVFEDVASAALEVTKSWLNFAPRIEELKKALQESKTRIHYTECATSLLQYHREDLDEFYTQLDAGSTLKEIADVVPDAANNLKRDRLVDLEDNIKRFYEILRPSEPTSLEEIDPADGVRGDIRIKASSRDKVDHASALFSYSNANALGMAAHIARIIEAGHETVVLDDPLQSLDDSKKNILIEDLIQELLEEDGLQVVILTHERKPAQKLLDIYASKGARGNSLEWKSNKGTVPKPMYPAGDRQLERILDVIYKDDSSRITDATNALRKLLEKFCADYLQGLGKELPPPKASSLGRLISILESLDPSVRPTKHSIANLKEWNEILSGEVHEDIYQNFGEKSENNEAPGIDQLKKITEKAIWARKNEKQLKPPNVSNWNKVPKGGGVQKRCNDILEVGK